MKNKKISKNISIGAVIFFWLICVGSCKAPTPTTDSVDYTEDFFIEKKYNYHPLELAFTFLGEREKFTDGVSNPVVLSFYKKFTSWTVTDTELAWCSAFVNSIYASTGYEYTGKLNARSWLNIGNKVDHPKAGDIVVFWRESPSSWKGHVAIYLTHNDKYVTVLGGNQSNEVNISDYSIGKKLAYIRPNKVIDTEIAYLEDTTKYIKLSLIDTASIRLFDIDTTNTNFLADTLKIDSFNFDLTLD